MRTAFIATASLATLCVPAASAHELSARVWSRPAANCPSPKPATKPTNHWTRPHCVVERRGSAPHSLALKRAYAERSGGRDHLRGPDDFGVAPSQAFVYGREFERDRHDHDVQWYAERNRGPVLGVAPSSRPGRPPEPDHGRAMADGSRFAGSYQFERRESESHGRVEAESDGRRYAWSWSFDGKPRGGPCGPCAAPGPDGGHWRYNQGGGYEVYRYAGRDDNGYLVWPGKPR